MIRDAEEIERRAAAHLASVVLDFLAARKAIGVIRIQARTDQECIERHARVQMQLAEIRIP